MRCLERLKEVEWLLQIRRCLMPNSSTCKYSRARNECVVIMSVFSCIFNIQFEIELHSIPVYLIIFKYIVLMRQPNGRQSETDSKIAVRS